MALNNKKAAFRPFFEHCGPPKHFYAKLYVKVSKRAERMGFEPTVGF